MTNFIKMLTGGKENPSTLEDENSLDSNLDYQFDEVEDEDTIFDLPIDVYQDSDNIYLRAFIPGVKPERVEVNATREIVEISGERIEAENIDTDNYSQRELIWGRFSKKVLLPNEINVDKVTASSKNGMFTVKLPKLNKDRSVKISLN